LQPLTTQTTEIKVLSSNKKQETSKATRYQHNNTHWHQLPSVGDCSAYPADRLRDTHYNTCILFLKTRLSLSMVTRHMRTWVQQLLNGECGSGIVRDMRKHYGSVASLKTAVSVVRRSFMDTPRLKRGQRQVHPLAW